MRRAGYGVVVAMTAEEFEAAYAKRSGWTVERLRKYRTVRPCDCGDETCEGSQSISHERAAEYDAAPDGEKHFA